MIRFIDHEDILGPRSEPSKLLEALLEIHREGHPGIVDPAALLLLMRATDQACSPEERGLESSELAIAGVGSIPEHAGRDLLRVLAGERFHGVPDRGVGAGRIPLRYWAGHAGAWPFALDADGVPVVSSIDETNQLSLAVWVLPGADDDLEEQALDYVATALRASRPNPHAERAIRCAEAVVMTGDPEDVLERRRRYLSHPQLRGRPELGSWVMDAMDPEELESPRFFRDVRAPEGIDWIARAAMSLPRKHRRAIGRGLMAAFRWRLDEAVPSPWHPEAAALLAITAPDVALRHADEITGARDVTPDDVEWLTGAELFEEERLAISEAYTEPIRPCRWDTKGRSLLLPGAPDLPASEERNVFVRGHAGDVLALDLAFFDEPFNTDDGWLICPYASFEILDLLQVTGRIAPSDRLAPAAGRNRTVEILGGWVYPEEDDDGSPDGS